MRLSPDIILQRTASPARCIYRILGRPRLEQVWTPSGAVLDWIVPLKRCAGAPSPLDAVRRETIEDLFPGPRSERWPGVLLVLQDGEWAVHPAHRRRVEAV